MCGKKTNEKMTKLMGILNITGDSFSDGGLYNSSDKAIEHANQLIADGADILDIGAQSTAYNAKQISAEEEWLAIEPILSAIDPKLVSIDTYNPETAARAIDRGVEMINDVKGGQTQKMLELIAANPHVKYISMLSLCIPAQRDVRVSSFDEIMNMMNNNIKTLKAGGIRDDQIILDPGLSFITDASSSFELIRRADEFKEFGYPILIGPSRKSFIGTINDVEPQDRDLETVLISEMLLAKNIDILRIHNVAWHMRARNIQKILQHN